MNNYSYYPFSAAAGQEDIKLALMLSIINPRIGGVLISGEKGVGKSTLVRGLSQLQSGVNVVNIPLGITEDRLTGSLSIEAAVKEGKREYERGLLYEADGNILYIDEVNLLSEHIVNILLTVSSLGENIVEREGVSYSHPCRFVLVGSMNPEEGLLKSHFLDKFGLYVEARGEQGIDTRIEIMKRRLDYESNPQSFIWRYREDDSKLCGRIEKARAMLRDVRITEEHYALFADISTKAECAGHRCEITLAETSKALAAYAARTNITDEDIACASKFVLPHRMRNAPPTPAEAEHTVEEDDDATPEEQEHKSDSRNSRAEPPDTNGSENDENSEDIGERSDLALTDDLKKKGLSAGSGKRNRIKTSTVTGRYIRSRFSSGKAKDIAFDATIRAAAYCQRHREKNGLMIKVAPSDIREKIREMRTGATILFVVDASGSMGAKRRMRVVKGAVMSLLDEAYQKRDRVGIVAFRGAGGEVLLNITRSVDLAEKQLRSLPTGGRTPLAAGLMQAYQLLKAEKLRNQDAQLYLVLVSDGKANVPLLSDNALDDALEVAESIRRLGANSLVIDTEKSMIEYGFARALSKRMDSRYVKLDSVSQKEIMSSVKDLIRNH